MSVSPRYAARLADSADGDRDAARVAEADTVVRVRNGETAVIAGLLRRETAARRGGGPGGLAGGAERVPLYTEIAVLLTPTVTPAGATTAGDR
jgi:hypothetical protein